MLFLLSPAKSLDFETPVAPGLAHTAPPFPAQSQELVELLTTKSPQQLAELMGISDQLAALNVARYAAWTSRLTAANSKQAILAFNGDVYDGLDAKTLTAANLQWAQDHVLILSGLYGALRPMDWIQPHRLEMGTSLANGKGKNLYAFWGDRIANFCNQAISEHPAQVIVNLASQEYFRAVGRSALAARVVECVFEDFKSGRFKVISFFAKRARGLMARYAIQNHINDVKMLEQFSSDGYAFAHGASSADRMVFRRKP